MLELPQVTEVLGGQRPGLLPRVHCQVERPRTPLELLSTHVDWLSFRQARPSHSAECTHWHGQGSLPAGLVLIRVGVTGTPSQAWHVSLCRAEGSVACSHRAHVPRCTQRSWAFGAQMLEYFSIYKKNKNR